VTWLACLLGYLLPALAIASVLYSIATEKNKKWGAIIGFCWPLAFTWLPLTLYLEWKRRRKYYVRRRRRR
jgi:hypothetical protein